MIPGATNLTLTMTTLPTATLVRRRRRLTVIPRLPEAGRRRKGISMIIGSWVDTKRTLARDSEYWLVRDISS